jgi:hypothetical protein
MASKCSATSPGGVQQATVPLLIVHAAVTDTCTDTNGNGQLVKAVTDV